MNPGSVSPEVPQLPIKEHFEEDISPIEADHLAFEQSTERKDDILHAERLANKVEKEDSQSSSTQPSAQPIALEKDAVVVEVESILEDGLGDFFASLNPAEQTEFKKRGEEVAREISEMVRTLHVKVKRVIQLISHWLKAIPGVNAFFLEQEAKIKADRIVALVEAHKKTDEDRV